MEYVGVPGIPPPSDGPSRAHLRLTSMLQPRLVFIPDDGADIPVCMVVAAQVLRGPVGVLPHGQLACRARPAVRVCRVLSPSERYLFTGLASATCRSPRRRARFYDDAGLDGREARGGGLSPVSLSACGERQRNYAVYRCHSRRRLRRLTADLCRCMSTFVRSQRLPLSPSRHLFFRVLIAQSPFPRLRTSVVATDCLCPLTSSPIHPFAHSRIHSLTQSLSHSVTQSLSHSVTQSLSHSVTHSLTHSVTHSLTHAFGHWLIHSLTHLFT